MKPGFLSDARMRGNFNNWLDKQAKQRFNPPGLDTNMAQYKNAAQGWQNAPKPQVQAGGDAYQNFYRNRSNEQPGTPTAAAPATASAPQGPRRF